MGKGEDPQAVLARAFSRICCAPCTRAFAPDGIARAR